MNRVVAETSCRPGDEVMASATSAIAPTISRFLRVRTLIRSTSEVELEHDLRKPRVEDLLRPLPAVERRVHAEHGVGVERIVDVEPRVDACAAEPQDLADAQIELIQ